MTVSSPQMAAPRHDGQTIQSFILVQSGDFGTIGRLTTLPLLRSLAKQGVLQARKFDPGQSGPLTIDGPTCILFIYCDHEAIAAIRSLDRGAHPVLVGVLGSDIYSYDQYTKLHDIVDFYVMPTDPHTRTLAYQVYRPVHTLLECFDPIALPAAGQAPPEFPIKSGRRAFWFGWAQSFEKGMASLMPAIQANVRDGALDDFQLIVDEAWFENRFELPTIKYDDNTFHDEASRFDYAILSHFPLDLQINSLIKSPNKVITALMAGAIPLASDTPNYRALYQRFGLEHLLFGSAMELDAKLRTLDPAADSEAIRRSGIVPTLRDELSESQMACRFTAVLHQVTAQDPEARQRVPDQCMLPAPEPTGMREHLRALGSGISHSFTIRARQLLRRSHKPPTSH